MKEIANTLDERNKRYGNYLQQAKISDAMSKAIISSSGKAILEMEADQRDAISMIVVKLSRILNGDPDYSDNWHDISGYATLVADRLDGNERK